MQQIDDYLNSVDVQALAKTTRMSYTKALQYLDEFCQKENIATLDPAFQKRMQDFCIWMRERHKAPTTVQLYVTIIKQLFLWHDMPIKFTYKISSKERKRKQLKDVQRWFNEDEIQQCLEYEFPAVTTIANKYRNMVIIRLLYETGARVQEISLIRGKHIDLDKNTVFLGTSKTIPRPAFFSDRTKELIVEWRKHMNYLFAEVWDRDPIFPQRNVIRDIVEGALKDMGLKNGKDGRGCHTFRHFLATYLFYEGNVDLTDIAFLLGDKPETIRDHYIHPTPEMLQRRIAKAMGWNK